MSYDSWFVLRFFRCFGRYVSWLTLHNRYRPWISRKDNMRDNRNWYRIFEYANRFSNVSMKKFDFSNSFSQEINLDFAKQQFVNVQEVSVIKSNNQKKNFKLLSPKVQRINQHSDEFSCLEQHFPHLKCLDSNSIHYNERPKNLVVSITECFRCNPQMCELIFSFEYDGDLYLLRNAAELLPSLVYLCTHPIQFYEIFLPLEPVDLKNATTFTYMYYGFDIIPMTFEKLEHFVSYRIHNYNGTYHARVSNFIKRNPTIVKLTACKEFFGQSNISEIFPSIQEVTIFNWWTDETITATVALALLNKMHTINTLNVTLHADFGNNAVADELKSLCGSKWQITERQMKDKEIPNSDRMKEIKVTRME